MDLPCFRFLMLYHGDQSDINLNQHDPPEFDSFQWMRLRDLPSQVRNSSCDLLWHAAGTLSAKDAWLDNLRCQSFLTHMAAGRWSPSKGVSMRSCNASSDRSSTPDCSTHEPLKFTPGLVDCMGPQQQLSLRHGESCASIGCSEVLLIYMTDVGPAECRAP